MGKRAERLERLCWRLARLAGERWREIVRLRQDNNALRSRLAELEARLNAPQPVRTTRTFMAFDPRVTSDTSGWYE